MTKNPCYVCGEIEFKLIFQQSPSMSSDVQIVDLAIQKEECTKCGTVRSAHTKYLDDFYEKYYRLNAANIDPFYVYNNVPTPKSGMHYEWISRLIGDKLKSCENMIEVGCGSGNLLSLFPVKEKYGIEPGLEAAAHAAKIASIRNIGYELIPGEEKYDFILSSCVIEHTIDPNDFLKKIHSISALDSVIVIGLPFQDTESFDVFFLDHLHHFTSGQFKHLCHKNGFKIVNYEIGYKCITTIGYFILQKMEEPAELQDIEFEKNTNFYTSSQWLKNINNFIAKKNNSKIAIFGFGETSFFFQTYSCLKERLNYFVDDIKAGTQSNVFTIKEAIDEGLTNSTLILLTNPHYHSFIKQKFDGVENLNFFSPFFVSEI